MKPEMPEPQPDTSRPERWRPRFSLGALLFVVLFAALGGSYPAVVVRETANRELREEQEAADRLPVRWEELKKAVQGLDAQTQSALDWFVNTAYSANSDEALRNALGDPDKLGGTQWTLNAVSGTDRISITIDYDGRRLQTHFNQVQGTRTRSRARSAAYPDHLRIGMHSDAFVLAASLIGMLVGGCFGLVAWGILSLLCRLWRKWDPDSEGPASGNAPTLP